MNNMVQEHSKAVSVKMDPSWLEHIGHEFETPYMLDLKNFLLEEQSMGQVVYPPRTEIFAAFNHTPFHDVRVVILGQDPYHGKQQANGLSFSVTKGMRLPPSLKNIFKEIHSDVALPIPDQGDLTPWAKQGVLLLNATLTVRASQPGSHQGKGWETFTDKIIQCISERKEGIVFLLWGKFAQAKAHLIDPQKHHILTAAHPSPYSASNGFFGCRHFSQCNALLQQQGYSPIDWTI